MNTPPTSENKEREYFTQEIERLYSEAVTRGENDLAIIFATMRAAIAGGQETSLAAQCALFSKRMIDAVHEAMNKQV